MVKQLKKDQIREQNVNFFCPFLFYIHMFAVHQVYQLVFNSTLLQ